MEPLPFDPRCFPARVFVNIYMNEFDQSAKHKLKTKYYIRYADDLTFFSHEKIELEAILPRIVEFLYRRLKLNLHPDKVSIKTFASGVDFLGWVHFPDHRVLRTTTKHRMLKRVAETDDEAVIVSYRGMLRGGNARKLVTHIQRPVCE